MPQKIYGAITALITPFANDQVDYTAYEKFINWQIEQGIHGIVPVGTTGESPTVTDSEHKQLIEVAVKVAAGRVPVIAGTGSNSTAEAIELSRFAEKAGADALLIVAPYYNKPTQEGLFQHYKAINDAVGIPIIVYNIPGRSIVDISVQTLQRMAELKNIAGIKDATSNLQRALEQYHALGDRFIHLSGDDATALPYVACGGVGVISVSSNVVPKQMAQVMELCLKGDFKIALQLHQKLMGLHIDLFAEANPAPVKYAAAKLGFCTTDVRLPLVACTAATKLLVDAAMKRAGL